MQISFPSSRCRISIATLLFLVIAPIAAFATYPGVNGKIAYTDLVDEGSPEERRAVFIHRQGQFTHPTPRTNASESDSDPAWSANGELLAFVRRDASTGQSGIFVVAEDGTGLRQVFNTAQPESNGQPGRLLGRTLTSLTWTPDGHDIRFVANSEDWWIGGADVGENLTLQGGDPGLFFPPEIDAGSMGLVTRCHTGGNRFCVFTNLRSGGVLYAIDVALPGVTSANTGAYRNFRWWPKSNQRKIAFTGGFSRDGVLFSEIFSVEYNSGNIATRVTQLTSSGVATCSNTTNGVTTTTQAPEHRYSDPVPSPDARYVLVQRSVTTPTYDANNRCTLVQRAEGVYQLRETGALQATLAEGTGVADAAWQPLPANVSVRVTDGHGNPLEDLKVELLDFDTESSTGGPLQRSAGGIYAFDDVPPGEYKVRVTLTDEVGQSFEIRHGWPTVTAVWADRLLVVSTDALEIHDGFSLNVSDSDVIDSNVGISEWERLDDLAAIYFQTHRFVKWVKANLTPMTGPLVPYYAFAAISPDFVPLDPVNAYYRIAEKAVYMGTGLSDHSNRDQPGDVAPENGEWHEFAHHLHNEFALPGLIQACPDAGSLTNHAGWLNQSTCDSLVEGFAMFLAALAEGRSEYAGIWELEDHTKAWGTRAIGSTTATLGWSTTSTEDVAAAALLWDLVDGGVESESAFASFLGSLFVSVNYTDNVQIPIAELWQILVAAPPKQTIFDLQRALAAQPGFSALSVDLDSDGVMDVNAVDPVFLMHGFHPVISILQGVPSTDVYRYDLEAARAAGAPANDRVGLSSHFLPNASGSPLALDPRFNLSVSPTSNVAFDARDASGTPLKNVELSLAVEYPDSEATLERSLPTGDGDLVHLELPPFFNYFLPPGSPLPPCNPLEDRIVTVTAQATINGYASPDSPSFDNCTYWHALTNTVDEAPFLLTMNFPEDSASPVTTLAARTLGTERLLGPEIGDYAVGGYWTVNLSCQDPVDGGFASGCHQVEYRMDGGPFVPYTEEIVLGPGLYTLDYRSIDAASNEETIRSRKLGVMSVYSTARPTTTLTAVASVPPVIPGETTGFWTVTMTCLGASSGTTPGAGCLRTEYSLDGGPFVEYTGAVILSEYGAHTLQYRSIDILNNQEATRVTQLWVVGGPDITAPVTEIIAESPAPSPFDPNQAMDSWRIRLNCWDNYYNTPGRERSGCASTEYSLDGGPFQLLNLGSEVLIEGLGQHVFEYRSIDVAGNQEALQSRTLEIVPSTDQDGDGASDFGDNCPGLVNSDQLDADADGVGDACNDADDLDGDEWSDSLDNCPNDSNADQSDIDLDWVGDVCDPFPEHACYYTGALSRSTERLAAFQNNTCERWYGASQPGDDLQSAVLAAVVLRYANLSGTNLSNANLTSADLAYANLSLAILTGAVYNESTIFPSGNTIAGGPWGLDGEITPWDAGMIPAPEPSTGTMLLFGAMGLAALSRGASARSRASLDEL